MVLFSKNVFCVRINLKIVQIKQNMEETLLMLGVWVVIKLHLYRNVAVAEGRISGNELLATVSSIICQIAFKNLKSGTQWWTSMASGSSLRTITCLEYLTTIIRISFSRHFSQYKNSYEMELHGTAIHEVYLLVTAKPMKICWTNLTLKAAVYTFCIFL